MGRAALFKQAFKGGGSKLFLIGLHGFAQEEKTGGMVGNWQRVAVAMIAESKFALMIRAPQLIRTQTGRERCAFGAGSRALHPGHQPMPIQDRMDGAASGHLNFGFSRLAAATTIV